MKLLAEAEIVDVHNILRTQKMTVKDMFTLLEGEKILVHVNEFDQLIKAAGGLCQRFMSLLLKEPNLCPPGFKNWKECKISCGIRLLVELRRRFSLPQRESVDKVIFAIFDEKFRTQKFRMKKTLFLLAAGKLNEANNIGEQERQYTEDELLQALDRIETPENFVEHRWALYKSHLRTSTLKKLSQYGKKARANQVHSHTTGAMSYARKKDQFKLIHKRDANDVEFFGISHEKRTGSYVTDISRELMDRAREEISKKVSVVVAQNGESVDGEKRSEIEREVMIELMGPEKSGRPRGYGAGVKRSQVTKFSFDLRKIRGEALTNENRYLLDKVEAQSMQIESQNTQIETQNTQIETQNQKLKIMEKKKLTSVTVCLKFLELHFQIYMVLLMYLAHSFMLLARHMKIAH